MDIPERAPNQYTVRAPVLKRVLFYKIQVYINRMGEND